MGSRSWAGARLAAAGGERDRVEERDGVGEEVEEVAQREEQVKRLVVERMDTTDGSRAWMPALEASSGTASPVMPASRGTSAAPAELQSCMAASCSLSMSGVVGTDSS